MCSICLQSPCHPRCPNAPDPVPIAYCEKCNEPLFAGDKVWNGICEECLDDMNTEELLELFDEKLEVLEEDY